MSRYLVRLFCYPRRPVELDRLYFDDDYRRLGIVSLSLGH